MRGNAPSGSVARTEFNSTVQGRPRTRKDQTTDNRRPPLAASTAGRIISITDDPHPPFWKPAICLKSPDDGISPASASRDSKLVSLANFRLLTDLATTTRPAASHSEHRIRRTRVFGAQQLRETIPCSSDQSPCKGAKSSNKFPGISRREIRDKSKARSSGYQGHFRSDWVRR
jgi:hypothetical protein